MGRFVLVRSFVVLFVDSSLMLRLDSDFVKLMMLVLLEMEMSVCLIMMELLIVREMGMGWLFIVGCVVVVFCVVYCD